MTTIEPPEVDVRSLGALRVIGSGGQGKVYEQLDEPNGLVYKEYSPRVVDDLDVDALRRFVAFAHNLSEPRRSQLFSCAAWPEAIVRRDGVVRGFLMRRVPSEFIVPMSFGREVTRELARVQFLLNPKEYLVARGLDIDARFRLEFLHDTAAVLELLHGLDISVGDLSPNNLVFSPYTRPRCFFIDCDAMRLNGESVLDQVETPDWQVGAEELATPVSDVLKFGLLTIRLFAGDQSLRDPHVVPTVLRPLVVRSLSTTASQRPTAAGWAKELRSTPVRPTGRRKPKRARTRRPPPTPPPATPPLEAQPGVIKPAAGFGAAAFGLAAAIIGVIFGLLSGSGGSSTPTRPITPATFYTPPTRYTPYVPYQPPVIPQFTWTPPPLVTLAPPIVPIQPVNPP